MDESLKEMFGEFIGEANELIDKMNECLVKLEKHPSDTALLNEVFRAAHTIKGSAGFMQLEKIQNVTHSLENVLDKLRKNELKLNTQLMDIILRAVDRIKQLIEEAKQGKDKLDITELITILNTAQKGEIITGTVKEMPVEKSEVGQAKKQEEIEVEETLRVKTKYLDGLIDLAGELVLRRNSLLNLYQQLSGEYDSPLIDRTGAVITELDSITEGIHFTASKTRLVQVKRLSGP